MNDSLKNLLKYLVYGVIIYLLIVVVPEKKTEISETIMITFIAVGSYMILDTFCASRKQTLEGMADDLGLDLDLDLDLDDTSASASASTTKIEAAKKANKVKESSTTATEDVDTAVTAADEATTTEATTTEATTKATVKSKAAAKAAAKAATADTSNENNTDMNKSMNVADVDSEPDMSAKPECNSVEACRSQMKEVHAMYENRINTMKKEHSNKISELEDSHRDLNRLNDKTLSTKNPDTKVSFGKEASLSEGKVKDSDAVHSVYKSTIGKAGTNEELDEFKQTTDYVMKSMNLNDIKFEQLDEKTKAKVLERAQQLLLRKQVMGELGIKNTAYKELPDSVKRKVDVMTMLAVDEAKGIAENNVKQYLNQEDQDQTRISKLRQKRMNDDDESWNESKYTEVPIEMTKPLGSYDDTMTNKWNHGYTYLNTDKWSVPMVRPPVCINNTPCNVCPSNTSGYPVNLMDFDSSRKITKSKINKRYINEVL